MGHDLSDNTNLDLKSLNDRLMFLKWFIILTFPSIVILAGILIGAQIYNAYSLANEKIQSFERKTTDLKTSIDLKIEEVNNIINKLEISSRSAEMLLTTPTKNWSELNNATIDSTYRDKYFDFKTGKEVKANQIKMQFGLYNKSDIPSGPLWCKFISHDRDVDFMSPCTEKEGSGVTETIASIGNEFFGSNFPGKFSSVWNIYLNVSHKPQPGLHQVTMILYWGRGSFTKADYSINLSK